MKNWFLKKLKNIGKPLSKLNKKPRGNTQINKIRNKKRGRTTLPFNYKFVIDFFIVVKVVFNNLLLT